ncbi:MAG: zinc ribbon domain-containing protein, partial [Candidatus Bathyarchaeia archaeon]
AFIIAIILSMAIVHMVKHESIGKAFAAGEVFQIIGRIGWGKYILWLLVIFIGILVLSAIGSIPMVGWLISLIVGPPFAVLVARSAGTIYQEGASGAVTGVAEVRYCTKCGTRLTADAVFCP